MCAHQSPAKMNDSQSVSRWMANECWSEVKWCALLTDAENTTTTRKHNSSNNWTTKPKIRSELVGERRESTRENTKWRQSASTTAAAAMPECTWEFTDRLCLQMLAILHCCWWDQRNHRVANCNETQMWMPANANCNQKWASRDEQALCREITTPCAEQIYVEHFFSILYLLPY